MEFFNNELASTLQYVSFPLEVVGLALAAIEVRFPETAKRIANQIKAAKQLSEDRLFRRGRFKNERPPQDSPTTAHIVYWINTRIALLGFSIATLFLVVAMGNAAGGDTTVVQFLQHVFFLFFDEPIRFLYIGAFFLLLSSSWVVFSAATNWVPDRELGTLGIIIAGFGVLGEAYQFTTQLVV